MDEQFDEPQAPEPSLEDMIRESLAADAAPGIPTPIDYGLPVPQRQAELSLAADESAIAPSPLPTEQDDLDYVESAEPERLPHEYAHPFPANEDDDAAVLSEEWSPAPVAEGEEPFEIQSAPVAEEADLPDVTIPVPQSADESIPLPPAADSDADIDEQIPLPEMQQSPADYASPFVFPDAGNPYQQSASGNPEINVTMEMPNQRELMEQARDQIEPLFRRVEQSFHGALEDAFDIESELMDRRNNY